MVHIRCPQCQQPLELVAEDATPHVDCPACGTHISFDASETMTYQARPAKTLGHFELLERVGRGTFGEVWRARDLELGRMVAVKLPRTIFSGDSASAFLREARSAAALRHPNIVPVHEVGRDDDSVYIVSDFIEGVTLSERLKVHGYTPEESARLCITLAQAVQHAHEAGVIHRDLKPGNILLDQNGVPHLTDFGLAKRETAEITVTFTGEVLGTPAYMSPEQARGDAHHADRRSDVYALGVILYEMLAQRKPFLGRDSRLLIHQILLDDPRPPRKLNRRVPRDLETICLKAMAKDPARRYQTAQELADDLQRFLDGRPILARRSGLVERAWRWTRRNPSATAALMLFAITLLLSVTLIGRDRNRVEGPQPLEVQIPVSAKDPQAIDGNVRIAVAQLNASGEIIPETILRDRGQPPFHFELVPGEYLIEVLIPGYGFHEVNRRVPTSPEEMPFLAHRTMQWTQLGENGVRLPEIRILSDEEVLEGMILVKGGSFVKSGRMGVPSVKLVIEDFYIDATEFTVRDYFRAEAEYPEGMDATMEDQVLADRTFERAKDLAETLGKRLPKEYEFEFAATNGGRTVYPWGDSLDPMQEWEFGPKGTPEYDRNAQGVANLASNVAEWTESVYTMREVPQPHTRVVRGGPKSVVEAEPDRTEWQTLGPWYRQGYTTSRHYPGLGFRCARSARPRLLD